MVKNMGSLDRIVRITLAIFFAGLYYANVISGITAVVLLAIGAVFALTSLVSFCPLYKIFGFSTCPLSRK
jgi:Protein of unknown function (DUF2892)